MFSPFLLVAGLAGIGSLVCWLIILIAAFQDAIWKGILGFFCGLYLLYFALFEYDAENKWTILGIAFICAVIGIGARVASGGFR